LNEEATNLIGYDGEPRHCDPNKDEDDIAHSCSSYQSNIYLASHQTD
jgi:hypothetical protein